MIFGSSGFTWLFSVIFLDWRLPQCRCMVSHGGAGVLHSTLRAGIPAIIAPFFGDQFFHAKLIQARELGAATIKVGVVFSYLLKVHQFLVDFLLDESFLRKGLPRFSINGVLPWGAERWSGACSRSFLSRNGCRCNEFLKCWGAGRDTEAFGYTTRSSMACQCASFCIQDPGLLGKWPWLLFVEYFSWNC